MLIGRKTWPPGDGAYMAKVKQNYIRWAIQGHQSPLVFKTITDIAYTLTVLIYHHYLHQQTRVHNSVTFTLRILALLCSPEHKVLKVSFCDRLLSVVRRQHWLVNTLEALFCILSSWKFIGTYISLKSRPSLKLGHVRSKTRSLVQI